MFLSGYEALTDTLAVESPPLSEACLVGAADDLDDLVDAARFRQLTTGNTTDPFAPEKSATVAAESNVASPRSLEDLRKSVEDLYKQQKNLCWSPVSFGTLIGGIGATAIGAYLWQKTKPF